MSPLADSLSSTTGSPGRAHRVQSMPLATRNSEVGARSSMSETLLQQQQYNASQENRQIPHYTEVVKLKQNAQATGRDYNRLNYGSRSESGYRSPQAQTPTRAPGSYSALNQGSSPPIPPPLNRAGSYNESVYYTDPQEPGSTEEESQAWDQPGQEWDQGGQGWDQGQGWDPGQQGTVYANC